MLKDGDGTREARKDEMGVGGYGGGVLAWSRAERRGEGGKA